MAIVITPMKCTRPQYQDVLWESVNSQDPACFVCSAPGVERLERYELPFSAYAYQSDLFLQVASHA